MKLEFSVQIFEKKCLNIKFRQNPFSLSRVVPCGETDTTKLIFAFRNFANSLNYDFLECDTTHFQNNPLL